MKSGGSSPDSHLGKTAVSCSLHFCKDFKGSFFKHHKNISIYTVVLAILSEQSGKIVQIRFSGWQKGEVLCVRD